MRLRNVKHAKSLIEENGDIVIAQPKNYKNHWHELFDNKNSINIEIGCGKGKFIFEKAIKNPNINYIGIEKFDSVIVRALEKIIKNPIANLKLIRIDAENIKDIFMKNEVNLIYLNFSDPWPKKRNSKRRLTSNKFLEKYKEILVKDSYIEFKTDNFELFNFSMMSFNNNLNYIIENINLNLYKNLPEDNVQTEFEMKFVKKGNLIFYQKVRYIGE